MEGDATGVEGSGKDPCWGRERRAVAGKAPDLLRGRALVQGTAFVMRSKLIGSVGLYPRVVGLTGALQQTASGLKQCVSMNIRQR